MINRDEITRIVIHRLAAEIGIKEEGINESTGLLSELKLDSMAIISLAMILEDEFSNEELILDDEKLLKLNVVGDVVDLIMSATRSD